MDEEIVKYNQSQEPDQQAVCELLAKVIQQNMPLADNKIWHGAPVWFLEGNPIVGYWVRKNNVQLLFWSGQSFGEPELKPEGSFKAAEARYTNVEQINAKDLKRWLKMGEQIQWDYKNIIKRKGKLVRLK